VDVLLSFGAALVCLRVAGVLLRAGRFAWAGGLASFAAAAGAMAWGAAHGWDPAAFRVYYLAGALLSAPLLGIGSLLLWGRRWAAPLGLVYVGVSIGLAAAMPVHGRFASVPRAQAHVELLPRIVAIAGSSLGALAVVVVALATVRRRPLGNALIIASVGAAGAASALTQTAVSAAAACFAAAALLLYAAVRA
jgi:hypothetical protein